VTEAVPFGRDLDRVGRLDSLATELRRRLTGRFPRDAFGLDPQLADALTPLFNALVRVRVEGAERLDRGAATLVMNRGFGIVEPTAVAVGVERAIGRRVRTVGAPGVVGVGSLLRRLGGIAASADDVRAALGAGHLVVLPLAPTWLRTGAGAPPLELMEAIADHPVHPVAVRASRPFAVGFAPWVVRVGAALDVDASYTSGDPLAAGDLAVTAHEAVDALLRNE
jgi:hypothetical protein